MHLKRTVAPIYEPVDLVLLKAHLRVDGSTDDTLLTHINAAAREWCEQFQNRAYIASTFALTLDRFPSGDDLRIFLPRAPLIAVSSVAYTDEDGAAQTVAAADYVANASDEPPKLYPGYGLCWPTALAQYDSVAVTFIAGSAVPFTANATTDVITTYGYSFIAGESFQLTNSGGALPAGLAANTTYYARDVSGNTCKLAATPGGVAIDITGAGTGTHFIGAVRDTWRQAILLLAAHWYENRSPIITGTISEELMFTLRSLLMQDRVWTPWK
jgi:uncharacterized phiE125 gp8 family phage protein